MSDLHVAVIGAGVVGLNTALNLQTKFTRCQVDLIADGFESDVTSYGPAGLFRVGTSFSGPNIEITRKWIADSYNFYSSLLSQPGVGVSEISGYIFSNVNDKIIKNHFMEEVLPIYRVANEDEKTHEAISWKYSVYIKTLITRCVQFLPWAKHKFQSQGGKVIKKKVNSLKDLTSQYDVIFNCSGLGARYLCNDHSLIPIRGQLLTVEAPWIKNFFYNEYDTHIFPIGSGQVLLGGCRNFESYNLTTNKHDTASIMERCESVLPSLRNSKLIREWVGLRPYRPQVRVELEYIDNAVVIHNYGHSAYGISTAPGTSNYAVDLFRHNHLSNSGRQKCRL